MSAKDALREAGFPEEKLKITYWGVPLDQFSPSRNEALGLQSGISNKFVVGYVGRFEKEKGLLTLLLALRRLPKLGHWQDTFLAKVKEFRLASRVHWIRRVPDWQVPAYMNAMDTLVLPSETTPRWKEQFGRVLPEAMACGLPIFASDSGAIPEIVGEVGLIFSERDYVELAEAIGKLAANSELCRHLSAFGQERAYTHFSCQAFATKLVTIYD